MTNPPRHAFSAFNRQTADRGIPQLHPNMILKKLSLGCLAIALSTTSGICNSAKISGRSEISDTPTNHPTTVFVADFELDAVKIQAEKGVMPSALKLPGPLGQVLPPPPGTSRDPQKLSRELVETMSEALIKRLSQAGFAARRLRSGEPWPASGWLVRGVFTEVNQGNQLRRSVIGFGSGKTDLQVLVDIADLSGGAPRNFYELSTTADSGKLPGAGPMIVLCPAGAAARFVIAGKDLHRNVKQTAAQIAREIQQRTKPGSRTLNPEPQRP